MNKILFIAFFGAFGALLRYGFLHFSLSLLRFFFPFFVKNFSSSAVASLFFSTFSTLISNILAAFILGIISAFVVISSTQSIDFSLIFSFVPSKKIIFLNNHKNWIDGLTLGFCGSLSTFSTFIKETFFLYQQQFIFLSIANVLANLFFSFLFFFLAYRLIFYFFNA